MDQVKSEGREEGSREEDADLALALAIHRQLNAPSRLTRAPRGQKAAEILARSGGSKKPRERRAPSASPESSSSGSEEEEEEAGGSPPSGRKRPRKGSEPEGSGSEPAASRRRPRDAGGAADAPGGQPTRRKNRYQSAAARAVAKAKAAASPAASGGERRPAYVKAFLAGVRWGALLPAAALRDRASLAAALGAAFAADGLEGCPASAVHAVFVTSDARSLEFAAAAGGGGEGPRWAEAASQAVRVYVRRAD